MRLHTIIRLLYESPQPRGEHGKQRVDVEGLEDAL